MCFSGLSVLVFVCTAFLSHSVDILVVLLTLPYQREVQIPLRQSSTNHLFLKSSQEHCSYYQKVRFYVYCIDVCFSFTSTFLLLGCFPLLVDVFPSILICRDLFSLNRLMTIDQQQYTTVAYLFMWVIITSCQLKYRKYDVDLYCVIMARHFQKISILQLSGS